MMSFLGFIRYAVVMAFFVTQVGCGAHPLSKKEPAIAKVGLKKEKKWDYSTKEEILALSNDGKAKVIIFSADWCKSCLITKRAIKDGGNIDTSKIYWINIDEFWVQRLATVLGVKNVPLMVHVDAKDNIVEMIGRPGIILFYLVRNFPKK